MAYNILIAKMPFESNLCEETNYVLSYPVLVWAKIEIPEEIKIATAHLCGKINLFV